MIRVVIADDIQILRQGLRAIMSQDKELEVVGLAADGKEAWEAMRLSQGLHQVSWRRFKLHTGSSTVSVTSLLDATGALKIRDSKNSILSFLRLFGSESVRQPKRIANMERCIIRAVT